MIKMRSYETAHDLRQMCEIVWESKTAAFHAGDLQLNLSDPSVKREEAIRIWEDDRRIIGFAFLHLSCRNFYFAAKPEYRDVESQIIEWTLEQLKSIADKNCQDMSLATDVPDYAAQRISLLESYGFIREEDYCIYLHYPLNSEIPPPKFPEGFEIRHLKNESDVPSYMTAHHNSFLFNSLTVEWRYRVRQMPYYVPELDLIVVSPDGEIAAFSFCWLEQSGNSFNDVRKGYIQIFGTQRKFQKMGIGQALFVSVLRRLKEFGAKLAVGLTQADNKVALHLYESCRVRIGHKIYQYRQKSNVGGANIFG